MKAVKLVIAAMMVVALMSLGGVAVAQEGSGEQPPIVQPGRTERPGPSNPDVAPTIQERGETALPFTGSDVTLFALVGAGAVGLGTVVLRVSKARRVEA